MAFDDIGVERDAHVAIIEMRRPPNNFLDVELLGNLATTLEELDRDPQCRAVVLAAAGKHFCAGGNLKQRLESEARGEKFVPAKRQPSPAPIAAPCTAATIGLRVAIRRRASL